MAQRPKNKPVFVFDTLTGEQLPLLETPSAQCDIGFGHEIAANQQWVAVGETPAIRGSKVSVFDAISGDEMYVVTASELNVQQIEPAWGNAMHESTLVLKASVDDSSFPMFLDASTGEEGFRVSDGYEASNEFTYPYVHLLEDSALLSGSRSGADALLVDLNTRRVDAIDLPDRFEGTFLAAAVIGDSLGVAVHGNTAFVTSENSIPGGDNEAVIYIHEEVSVKARARRARNFPDIHSASSAEAERHESYAAAPIHTGGVAMRHVGPRDAT